MSNILHFGELRLNPGVNHYSGDLYVIGKIYDTTDSSLIVDGNLYVSDSAYLKEIKVSGSVHANQISCTDCYVNEDMYIEKDLDAKTVIAGGSILVKGDIFTECIACFESISASFIDAEEIHSTFIECKDISLTNITVSVDTLVVNGPLIFDAPESNIRINAREIHSSNVNIG